MSAHTTVTRVVGTEPTAAAVTLVLSAPADRVTLTYGFVRDLIAQMENAGLADWDQDKVPYHGAGGEGCR